MKTALYNRHIDLQAKIVDFFGWQMPMRYPKGTLKEHQAVRHHAGLFDVSHMGIIQVEGGDALPFLDYLSPSILTKMKPYTSIYTVWCDENAHTIDDVIIFKKSDVSFFVVVNASNREKDLKHLSKYAEDFDVFITPLFTGYSIIALQGPKAREYIDGPLRRFTFIEKGPLIISATGYTGEDGFEIIGPDIFVTHLFDHLISQGVEPIGLGARDLLRLEKGYALYGHELSDSINPLESVSSFTVKKEANFLGDKGILNLQRTSIALVIDEGIAREGACIYLNNQEVGRVTSGSFSPSLNKAIALGLIKKEAYFLIHDNLFVDIRGNKVKAKKVNIPFV